MAFEALISAYTLSPPNYKLLLVSLIAFIFGYVEYIYSFLLVTREGKAPYPLWMHTFYFAHDSTWTSAALLIWNGFEVFNLYMAVAVDRDDTWAWLRKGGVKGKGKEKEEMGLVGPLLDIAMQIAGFYCVVNLLIEFMGTDPLFEWFLFTNILMVWGPGALWRMRKDRRGCSVGLAIVIVVATVNTFAPWSMWILAMPERFDNLWFRVSGVVFTGVAIENLRFVLRLKPKKWEKGGGKLIW